MARSSVTLRGFRELDRALKDLPKATARGVLVRTAVKAMEPMRRKMAELAPYDENDRDGDGRHLRDTIRTQNVAGKVARKLARRFGTVDRDAGVVVLTGPAPQGGRALTNAYWQEFGTKRMPANAYVRPAADAESDTVFRIVEEELGRQIEKSLSRLAKRAAKGR